MLPGEDGVAAAPKMFDEDETEVFCAPKIFDPWVPGLLKIPPPNGDAAGACEPPKMLDDGAEANDDCENREPPVAAVALGD